ncbi:MAG: cell division protein FtsZ [Acetobacteraceae bacterium]|nr:cell division protein FtsZ [Acetobacteraceae bacterium]
MVLNLSLPPQVHPDFQPRIAVIGVGGAGCNAVNNMITLDLEGCDFIVANTDAQTLAASRAERRIQLGPHLTQGLGAGGKPEIGRAAAEEAADDILEQIEGAHMIFVTAGMGGGTGTGAAPVIARLARERGILTVGVVSKPFEFEGRKRKSAADAGIESLQGNVDTLIVIPNQNLFRLANDRTTFQEALKLSDNVLYMGVRGVTDLIVNPGLVNLDFADIRAVMGEMGKAMMGTGECDGEARSVRAAEAAIQNPLLEDTSMKGARAVLINITGGYDMTLHEVDAAAKRIKDEVEDDANIIFGTALDEAMTGRVRVSVVATGMQAEAVRAAVPAVEAPPARQHGARVQVLRPVPSMRPDPDQPAAASAAASVAPAAAVAAAASAEPGVPAAAISMPEAVAMQPAPARAEPGRLPELFTESEQPAPPPAAAVPPNPVAHALRVSPGNLFRRMTGLVGGRLAEAQVSAAPTPAPARAEPVLVEPAQAPQGRTRVGQNEDSGLDIPAFLRRQAN